MNKRRVRFCDFCEDGVRYGREKRCRACRESLHAAQKLAWHRTHARTKTPRICPDCGCDTPVQTGPPGRCKPCLRLHRKRLKAARPKPVVSEAVREYRRMYHKARNAVGKGEPAQRLLREWGFA